MDNFEENLKIGFGLFVLVVALLALGGWVANIVKIFGMWGASFTTELIIRLLGVFIAPLGAVAGYF